MKGARQKNGNDPPENPGGLKSKLIRIMLGVGAAPLLLAMVIAYFQGHQSLQEVIGSSFKALAYETSTKIDFLLQTELANASRLARHPTLILSLKERNRFFNSLDPEKVKTFIDEESKPWETSQVSGSPIINGVAGRTLQRFLAEDNHANRTTRALFITDLNGTLIASANSYPGFDHSGELSRKASVEGNFTLGDLVFNEKNQEYVFQYALPIRATNEKIVGTLHRLYSAKGFFSSYIEPIVFGETGHVMIINRSGVVIDCPILPTGFRLTNASLIADVTSPRPDWSLTQGNGHGSPELSIIGYSPLGQTARHSETRPKWHIFAWQASDELFAPTQKLFLWVSSAGFASVLLILFIGSFASEKIVEPIKRVQETAIRIGRGEPAEPLKIHTGDEIEGLANEINAMNKMIQASFSGLENQVRSKTQEVSNLKGYMENILMSVPDAIIIFNQNLEIEYVNSALETLLEIRESSFTGKTLGELDSVPKPAAEILTKKLEAFLGNASNRDASPATIYKPRDPLAPAISRSEPGETQPTVSLGENTFTYRFFNVGSGENTRRTGLLLRNVTEEKRLMKQLIQAEKLSGLGTLTAGIAHEMNNPLYSIMGFTEAIQGEQDPSKIRQYAGKVLRSSKHMASVILNFSGYSRNSDQNQFADVEINKSLDVASEIASVASYSNDIKLSKSYGEISPVRAKPEEIQQVFVNIIKNAIQAMKGRGDLFIGTAQKGNEVEIVLRDSGPGIPPEYLSRIFDPFFTTKKQGEGTGLGLNIVHRIIEKYKGTIRVESPPERGTSFILTFPSAESLRNVQDLPGTSSDFS